jgi:hypothetical protein
VYYFSSVVSRAVLQLVIGALAFAATAGFIHCLLPLPEVGAASVKLRFLQKHRDDYDAIFIGSSRVFPGISPEAFDRVTGAAGFSHRSFNFGADGALPPQEFYIIERLLEMRPRTWRWVFIELNEVQVHLSSGSEGTQQSVYWHDWSSTAIIFQKLLDLDVKEKFKRRRNQFWQSRGTLWLHTDLLLKNFANVGRAESLRETIWPKPSSFDPTGELGPGHDGFGPVNRQLTPEQTKAYQRWLAHEAAKNQLLDPYASKRFPFYAQQFRALGATTIFFVTPASPSLVPSMLGTDSTTPVLAFNDPQRYPDLYRPEARLDEAHLNAAGAENFSRVLAQRFVETFETKR